MYLIEFCPFHVLDITAYKNHRTPTSKRINASQVQRLPDLVRLKTLGMALERPYIEKQVVGTDLKQFQAAVWFKTSHTAVSGAFF